MKELLIGVIAGFLLSLLREYLLYKPRLNVEMITKSIGYRGTDSWGGSMYIEVPEDGTEALDVIVEMRLYNSGRAPTAIKGVSLCVEAEGRSIKSNPRVEKRLNNKGEDVKAALNLSPGTIEILKLSSSFDLGESEHQLSYQLHTSEIKGYIIVTDIYNKGKKIDL